jgi:hypothetical protein
MARSQRWARVHGALLTLLVLGAPVQAKARLMRVFDWRNGLPIPFIGKIEQDPQGFIWFNSYAGVFRYDGSEMVRQLPPGPHFVRGSATVGRTLLAASDGALWIAYDTQLVRLDHGEPKEIFATRDRLTRGGSLLVDHEGSLWIGTMRGLLQLPEPDSMSWPSEAPVGGIQLLSDRGALWMSAWTSVLKPRENASTWVLDQLDGTVDAPCADRDGNVWSASLRFPHPRVGAGMRPGRRAELGWVLRCAPSPRGGVWLPATHGIFHVAAGADAPERWAATTAGAEPFRFSYENTDGTLWTARGCEICSTHLSASRANTTVHWSRADVLGPV